MAGVSLLLHAVAVWALLPHRPGAAVILADTPPTLEIEMVNQDDRRQGAQAAAPAQPPPAPPMPELAPKPVPDPTPGSTEVPAPPPPSPPAPAGPASPFAAVNLSGGDEDRDALSVTGDNVVPPRPDATIHNRPPAYPPEAARHGHQGTVDLLIHVTELGVPAWVEVRGSSGDPNLDAAARDAISAWRFRPAFNGRTPVPFDMPYQVVFSLGGGSRSLFNGQDRQGYDPRR